MLSAGEVTFTALQVQVLKVLAQPVKTGAAIFIGFVTAVLTPPPVLIAEAIFNPLTVVVVATPVAEVLVKPRLTKLLVVPSLVRLYE